MVMPSDADKRKISFLSTMLNERTATYCDAPVQQHQQPNSNLLKPTDSEMKLQDSFNLIRIESEDAGSNGIYNKACQEGDHPQAYAKEMNSNGSISKASAQVPEEIPPRDKWNTVQIILIIQGLATLMPWNMFINAKSYFENYKLSSNGTDQEINDYKTNFMSYITICSMVPSVIFSVLNTFITRSSGASPARIVAAKIIMIILLAMTIVLACLDSSSSATSVFQNNLFGIGSVLPGKYINAVLIGANSCGILTSVSQIISIAISSDAKISAIIYFSSGILILIIALITNRIFQRLPFYRFYSDQVSREAEPRKEINVRPQYWTIFKKIWKMCFTIWFTFTTTIVNFPNTTGDVRRIHFPMSDTYWIPVMCFLNFNTFAVVGTLPSRRFKYPTVKYIWLVAIIRGLICIPFFMFCNYLPEQRTFPVYFSNDYVYIIGIVLLALTNAHLTTLSFQYGPTLLKSDEVVIGGMMLNIFLYLGILSGGFLSFLYPYIVKNVGSSTLVNDDTDALNF
ncbi:equilibrative nucleoside transporter 1-like isoform X2 [Octopus sinensis]|uniref:Equilibrative nucleoside transporter 1-like isoform X2 n=1 Tax=Octopus sinensis TaxID=2607531 RepID=A0A7E6FKU0_9MOLL|nr:equilibrative nucleoside transporter 1-like isoform X2 [Octopus sinensis]